MSATMVSVLVSETCDGAGEGDGADLYTGVADTSIVSVHGVPSISSGIG